jgi:hypothetical protein
MENFLNSAIPEKFNFSKKQIYSENLNYLKIVRIFLFVLLIPLNIVNSQLVTKIMSYNGPGSQIDKCNGIVVDKFGYVYATGVSWGNSSTREDYATIKFGEDGDFIWASRYNGPGNNLDYASAIAIDNNGFIYVTGWSRSGSDYASEDYCTIKYDNNGNQIWVKRYNGPGNCYDQATALAVDDAGNIYITGISYGGSSALSDYATIKYASNGNQLWVARYNGPSQKDDEAYSITVDASGNVYVTGASYTSGKGYDYLTVKYNASGQQLWTARYDGPSYLNDIPSKIKLDKFGNVFVTGASHGGNSKVDYVTIKYNSSAQQQWLHRYNNSAMNDTDAATGLDIDVHGNVYVTGYSKSPASGSVPANYDFHTIKYYGFDGSIAWQHRVHQNRDDKAYDIRVINKPCNPSSSGNGFGDIPCWLIYVYVTGESFHTISQNDFFTVAYNEYGNVRWQTRYNGPQNGNDAAYSIFINPNYPIIYTGGIFSSDYGIIGIAELSRTSAENTDSFNGNTVNYPNPFNPLTTIYYKLPMKSNVKIIVYDLLGREVAKLTDEIKPEGINSVTFNAISLNSGIYFYRITTDFYNETKKIVLVK